jgi:hypothetical protein
MNKKLLLLTLLVLFTGCGKSIPILQERKATAFSLSKEQNLQERIYQTTHFNLLSYRTSLQGCENINIFIEGDGLAWVTKNQVSSNPTPLNPVGLKLMLKNNSMCKLYLARPCQYTNSAMCEKKYWTSHRFNEKVIESYVKVLDEIKNMCKTKSFILHGYSGGGSIAAIVSAKRKDVKALVTYAGNLDTDKWTTIHNITPLMGSLNPADFIKELQNLPQTHYVGIIPIEIFQSFRSKFTHNDNIKLILLNSTHSNIAEKF